MVKIVNIKIDDLYRLYSSKQTIIRVSAVERDVIKYVYLSSDLFGFRWLIGDEFQCIPSEFLESFEKIVSPSKIWKSLNEV